MKTFWCFKLFRHKWNIYIYVYIYIELSHSELRCLWYISTSSRTPEFLFRQAFSPWKNATPRTAWCESSSLADDQRVVEPKLEESPSNELLSWWFPVQMVSKNSGTPQIIHFNRVFHYKPSILGVPLFSETHKWFPNKIFPTWVGFFVVMNCIAWLRKSVTKKSPTKTTNPRHWMFWGKNHLNHLKIEKSSNLNKYLEV